MLQGRSRPELRWTRASIRSAGGSYVTFWLGGASLTDKVGSLDWQVLLYSRASQCACSFHMLRCDLGSSQFCSIGPLLGSDWGGRYLPKKPLLSSHGPSTWAEFGGLFLWTLPGGLLLWTLSSVLLLFLSVFLPNVPNRRTVDALEASIAECLIKFDLHVTSTNDSWDVSLKTIPFCCVTQLPEIY